MKKVTVVEINGYTYLGTLNKTKTILEGAFNCQPNPGQEDFAGYLKDKNLDLLETKEFGGNGVSYTISQLTDTQKLAMKVCELHMQQAKATAVKALQNDTLDALLGK